MRAAGVLNTSCTIVGTEIEGCAAIDAAATLQPDVIVLDISMPGMNGFEVAASLREAGSTAALIFLTAHQDEEFIAVRRSPRAPSATCSSSVLPPILSTPSAKPTLVVDSCRLSTD